jgi:hypothetical protein
MDGDDMDAEVDVEVQQLAEEGGDKDDPIVVEDEEEGDMQPLEPPAPVVGEPSLTAGLLEEGVGERMDTAMNQLSVNGPVSAFLRSPSKKVR